ncbi:MAG: hypothetical protein ABSG43_28210, partial [Solirubrobacteraceae bacterium]
MAAEEHQRAPADSQQDEHRGHRNHRAEGGEPSWTARGPRRPIAWLAGCGTLAYAVDQVASRV